MPVLVIGLAATGEAVARHFASRGERVVVVEDSPSDTPAYAARVVALATIGAQLFERPTAGEALALVAEADLVVPSPGVPERHPALVAAHRAGTPVRSEIDLAASLARSAGRPAIVAVTGTNGKTTVTTLAAARLETAQTIPTWS